MKIETVQTKTFAMDYFKFGEGKKNLVILPGISIQNLMNFSDIISENYKILVDEFTVYVFERRTKLPSSYSVYDMSRDTVEVFKILGLENIYLFGVSQGGMIAIDIAINHPKLIEKMVLGSTSASVNDVSYKVFERWINLAKNKKTTELYLAFGKDVYSDSIFESSKKLLIDAAKNVTNDDLNRFIILAEGMKGFDVVKNLEKIICPVLIIGSSDDKIFGKDSSLQILEHLNKKYCKLFMYEGFGHAAYDIASDYKERILEFFISKST